MSDYSIAEREQADDYMADYPGFGELRSFGVKRLGDCPCNAALVGNPEDDGSLPLE